MNEDTKAVNGYALQMAMENLLGAQVSESVWKIYGLLDAAELKGYANGFKDGLEDGKTEGLSEGYQRGAEDFWEIGFVEGYDYGDYFGGPCGYHDDLDVEFLDFAMPPPYGGDVISVEDVFFPGQDFDKSGPFGAESVAPLIPAPQPQQQPLQMNIDAVGGVDTYFFDEALGKWKKAID